MHGTYPFPVHHTYDKYAMIDTENIDSEQWPKAGEVSCRSPALLLVQSALPTQTEAGLSELAVVSDPHDALETH